MVARASAVDLRLSRLTSSSTTIAKSPGATTGWCASRYSARSNPLSSKMYFCFGEVSLLVCCHVVRCKYLPGQANSWLWRYLAFCCQVRRGQHVPRLQPALLNAADDIVRSGQQLAVMRLGKRSCTGRVACRFIPWSPFSEPTGCTLEEAMVVNTNPILIKAYTALSPRTIGPRSRNRRKNSPCRTTLFHRDLFPDCTLPQ